MLIFSCHLQLILRFLNYNTAIGINCFLRNFFYYPKYNSLIMHMCSCNQKNKTKSPSLHTISLNIFHPFTLENWMIFTPVILKQPLFHLLPNPPSSPLHIFACRATIIGGRVEQDEERWVGKEVVCQITRLLVPKI